LGELSRRELARVTAKAGVATGAAIGLAPQLSSVALAQTTAGSPPPSSTTNLRATTRRPRDPADPGDPGATAAGRSGGTGTAGMGTPGAGGELALTGSDVRTLAATGGAAVLTGAALVAGERLSDRHRRRPAIAAEGSSDETAR
jgi:hypothetical protein